MIESHTEISGLTQSAADAHYVQKAGDTMTGKLVIGGVTNDTSLSIVGATHTGADASPDLSIASTWNTSAAITAFKLNITNTASGAGSLLMDLQAGGVSMFNVFVTGGIATTSDNSSQFLKAVGVGGYGTAVLSINITAGGVIFNQGLAATGVLSSYVGTGAWMGYSGATPVASLTKSGPSASPAAYAIAVATDAVAWVTGAIPTGGGSVIAPVFYNGTSWIMMGGGPSVVTAAIDNGTTGLSIGGATSNKLGFYGAAVTIQPSATGTTTGFTQGTGTIAMSSSTYTGNTGSTAYTVGDIVNALKKLGLMAA